ncbi:MAG: YetF domain-containing protein, partial [Acidobacteriota bacterium]
IEGRPQVLIHDGMLFKDVMAKAQITQQELMAALRQAGCGCVEDVRSALLENNGAISVIQRTAATGESPTDGDI